LPTHGPHWEVGTPKKGGQKDPAGRDRLQNGNQNLTTMNKLEILIRQNKRREVIESCKHQLSDLLGSPINETDFLSIERTDLLTNKFYNSFKSSNDKICERYSANDEKVGATIERLCLKFSDSAAYLITKQTEACGLIKVPVDKMLKKYIEIIELDGDSLCLLSTNESEGIYIDYFEETNEQGSSWYYEVCFWKL
jgi:hypothetical protein